MGFRKVGGLLLALAAGFVAGCDLLAGPPPSGFVPEAGVCHLRMGDNASGTAYRPVTCAERHEAETFLVGRFAGADADSDEPPANGSKAALRAYGSCGTAAREFLGDDWRTGRLTLRLVLPTADGWAAAERWYRCDLAEILALDVYEAVPLANSLKDTLRGPSPALRHGCYNPTFGADGEILTLPPASCHGPHQSEYAGVWRTDDVPYGEKIPDDDAADGCYGVVARYLGVADEQEVRHRLYPIYLWPSEEELAAGETSMLCLLYTDGKPLTRPLAGVGLRGLPAIN